MKTTLADAGYFFDRSRWAALYGSPLGLEGGRRAWVTAVRYVDDLLLISNLNFRKAQLWQTTDWFLIRGVCMDNNL